MKTLLAFILICLFALPQARAVFPKVALKAVVLKQIHSPTTITHAPDGSGRLFVCDQMGKVFIIQGGMLLPTPFLNIASTTNAAPNNGPGPVIGVGTGYAERGLLGLTFHPGFANSASPGFRKFYVNYNKTYAAGIDPDPPQVGDPVNCVTVIAEFEVSATNPNVALNASERRVLAFTQPQNNHNGGMVEFGHDGMLYIGCGDGGSQEDNNAGHTGGAASPRPTDNLGNSQDRTRYLGKILRINPLDPDGAGALTYSIPTDNPFFNDPMPGLKKEIYAFGLRNPWRFSFDKRAGGTNRMFCGDVGGGRIEEIDLIVSGGNYGWRYKEGVELPTFSSGAPSNPMPHPGGTLIDPIAMYAHTGVVTSPVLPQLGLSVTGGFVYRGAAIPAMQGKFVFGDYGSTSTASSWNSPLMGLEETAPMSGVFTLTQAIPLLGLANPIVGQRILCLGEGADGEIYIGMKTNAGVLQLDGGLPSGGIYKIVPVTSGSATMQPSKDNTIFSEDVPLATSKSDALGFLFAGRTGPNFGPYLRRALLAFDVGAGVPPGSVIQTAQLALNLNKVGPGGGGVTLALHRLNETWGEGTSQVASGAGIGAAATTNDATWLRRFFNTSSWTTAGGSFQATASASQTVAFGMMTWGSTPQMVSDVQGWVSAPLSNAGWMLRGDESTDESACRFDSGEMGITPPELTVTYQAPPPPTYFEVWLQTHFPLNLTGQFVDPEGDPDGDGIKSQIEYSAGLSPLAHDATDDFSVTANPLISGATDLVLTFRRDIEATDLVYRLQVSDNLLNWTTIAESVNGAATTGMNGGVLDNENGIGGTVILVTVRLELAAGLNSRKFARMKVDRY